MDYLDFTDCQLSYLQYGGAAGRKLGVIYDGSPWLLKFPDSLKSRDLRNVEESYGNNPLSEHIGSYVFRMLGIPVHQTLMGKYRDKIVVACKDFTTSYNRLVEFREFKVSYQTEFTDYNGAGTNGTSLEISEALDCIQNHPVLRSLDGVERRFWSMFIVDALNGNPDRNNGNWGCLLDRSIMRYTLAPVYDNGNCLYFRFSTRQIEDAMGSEMRMQQLAVNGVVSRFVNHDHKINPFTYIRDNLTSNSFLFETLREICSNFKFEQISSFLDETVDCAIRRSFYKELYLRRFYNLSCLLHDTGSGINKLELH